MAIASGAPDRTGVPPFRFAFSARMFSGVNENDAKAAIKVWSQNLAKERNIPLAPQPILLQSRSEIVEALQSKSVDAVSLATDDYLALPPELHATNLLASSIAGHISEQYLLLVHSKSPYSGPADLKGRSLMLSDNVRASLAVIWLDVTLAKEGLGSVARHFGQVREAKKLTAVVLPVFFRQQEACVVSRSGFEVMCELNPQLRAQLKALLTSPEVVPAFTFFRPDFRENLGDEIINEVLNMQRNESGKQILTLFQTDHLEQLPTRVLDSARALIEAHKRLIPGAGGDAGGPIRFPPKAP